jgi:thioredoxin-related protein
MLRVLLLLLPLVLALPVPGIAAGESPAAAPPPTSAREIPIPSWFKLSFLDIPDDVRDATTAKRRVMLYFGQDGCPYCLKLMQVDFTQKHIVDLMRRHFDAIAFNIWGSREVTWLDGKTRTEKELAHFLKIQFTPTLLFLDEKGNIALRVNGYYPPSKFTVALDYVAGHMETRMPFPEYMKKNYREHASGMLHDEPFFVKPPYELKQLADDGKPLMVLFEKKNCAACDELHAKTFKDAKTMALIRRFSVARLDVESNQALVAPDGTRTTVAQWADALGIAYTPTLTFFDGGAKEVFRVEGYVKPFHFASGLEYVASGAFHNQPDFQKFLEARAQRLRARGETVKIF